MSKKRNKRISGTFNSASTPKKLTHPHSLSKLLIGIILIGVFVGLFLYFGIGGAGKAIALPVSSLTIGAEKPFASEGIEYTVKLESITTTVELEEVTSSGSSSTNVQAAVATIPRSWGKEVSFAHEVNGVATGYAHDGDFIFIGEEKKFKFSKGSDTADYGFYFNLPLHKFVVRLKCNPENCVGSVPIETVNADTGNVILTESYKSNEARNIKLGPTKTNNNIYNLQIFITKQSNVITNVKVKLLSFGSPITLTEKQQEKKVKKNECAAIKVQNAYLVCVSDVETTALGEAVTLTGKVMLKIKGGKLTDQLLTPTVEIGKEHVITLDGKKVAVLLKSGTIGAVNEATLSFSLKAAEQPPKTIYTLTDTLSALLALNEEYLFKIGGETTGIKVIGEIEAGERVTVKIDDKTTQKINMGASVQTKLTTSTGKNYYLTLTKSGAKYVLVFSLTLTPKEAAKEEIPPEQPPAEPTLTEQSIQAALQTKFSTAKDLTAKKEGNKVIMAFTNTKGAVPSVPKVGGTFKITIDGKAYTFKVNKITHEAKLKVLNKQEETVLLDKAFTSTAAGEAVFDANKIIKVTKVNQKSVQLMVITTTVQPANNPPILASIGNKEVKVGETLTFTISATDKDNDKLFYLMQPGPEGATFDQNTRTFSWTPAKKEDIKKHPALFKVTDDKGGVDTEAISINVIGAVKPDTKQLLVLTEENPLITTLALNEDFLFQVGQKGASIKVTGLVPGFKSFYVLIDDKKTEQVKDGVETKIMFAETTGYLTISTPNQGKSFSIKLGLLPVFGADGIVTQQLQTKTIKAGQDTIFIVEGGKYKINVASPVKVLGEGGTSEPKFIFTVTDMATKKAVQYASTKGKFSNDISLQKSKVLVELSVGNFDTKDFVLGMKLTAAGGTASASTQVNQPPVLAPIGNKNVQMNVKLTFTISATDADNDALTYSMLTNTNQPQTVPQGATFDASKKTFTWTPAKAGTFMATFKVSDGKGGEDTETVTITVTAPSGPSCTDTDGKDTAQAGKVTAVDAKGATKEYSDSCITGKNRVTEYSCIGATLQITTLNCPQGTVCKDGACIAEAAPKPHQVTLANPNDKATVELKSGELIDLTLGSKKYTVKSVLTKPKEKDILVINFADPTQQPIMTTQFELTNKNQLDIDLDKTKELEITWLELTAAKVIKLELVYVGKGAAKPEVIPSVGTGPAVGPSVDIATADKIKTQAEGITAEKKITTPPPEEGLSVGKEPQSVKSAKGKPQKIKLKGKGYQLNIKTIVENIFIRIEVADNAGKPLAVAGFIAAPPFNVKKLDLDKDGKYDLKIQINKILKEEGELTVNEEAGAAAGGASAGNKR